METVESLAARLKTTAEIGDIVRVMKTLSSVSIRQYDLASEALEDYRRTVELGLQAVLQNAARALPEPAGSRTGGRVLVFVGSDRGLCGNFNDIIAGFAGRNYLARADQAGPPPYLIAVGQRGARHIEALGHRPDHVIDLPGSVLGLASVARRILLALDARRQKTGEISIDICYNRRTGQSTASPHGQRLLPVPHADLTALASARWPSRGLPFHRMARRDLLPALFRERVFIGIYSALASSLASEHARRLAAMQSADRNIAETVDALNARHRTRRQEEITAELLDIVSGYKSARRAEEQAAEDG